MTHGAVVVHDDDPLARVSALVRAIPDFPEPGVVFRDITPVLADGQAFTAVSLALAALSGAADVVVGVEARGFLLGAAAALTAGTGIVPVRKAGKLPRAAHAVSYALEYGQATLEMHEDALHPGDRVLVIDDVLATGGTLAATRELVALGGGKAVGAAVLMELSFLPGRETIGDLPLVSLMTI